MSDLNVSEYSTKEYALKVLKTAGEAAKLTMQYGGGANRAEEVYCRICNACKMDDAQISAVSTSLSSSVSLNQRCYTSIFRVNRRGINLSKLNDINNISRSLADSKISLNQAQQALSEIESRPGNSAVTNALAAGFSSAFFSLLLKGGVLDFAVAFIIGAFINFIISIFEKAGAYSFVNNLFGGIIDAGLAILINLALSGLGAGILLEAVVVGAMMPLLPGLAMTTAIRDTISGDYVSGTACVMEALSMAIALAAGAALSFGIFISMGVSL